VVHRLYQVDPVTLFDERRVVVEGAVGVVGLYLVRCGARQGRLRYFAGAVWEVTVMRRNPGRAFVLESQQALRG
jgi:hypothetical protein